MCVCVCVCVSVCLCLCLCVCVEGGGQCERGWGGRKEQGGGGGGGEGGLQEGEEGEQLGETTGRDVSDILINNLLCSDCQTRPGPILAADRGADKHPPAPCTYRGLWTLTSTGAMW